MSVVNQNISDEKFMLWFFNKKGQKQGERQGELYRICQTPQRTWMYLDGYVHDDDKGSADHPVKVDRALLIFDGKEPIDLVVDGEHKACGETGQPYLIWSPTDRSYRVQVWGHLVENAKWRWYWDAQVTSGETVENDCLSPGKKTPTVKVQEAWWNNFKVPAGEWGLGKGEMSDTNGWPTGMVAFGRTVWHGNGRIPYFMTGDANSRPTWCVRSIAANPKSNEN